jgi:AAA family ATP:ADP antiporter
MGMYREVSGPERHAIGKGGWRALVESKYIFLIAVMLLLAQLAQPVVEYQFMSVIAATYDELNARTAYISYFFSVLGIVAIGVNLVITPLTHRFLGTVAGLLAQPLLLCVFSFVFMAKPILTVAAAMKISDRGLSYSINRASKELLYIPVDPVQVYQAKAWIDMLGYRLFKVAGSVLILLFTKWLPVTLGLAQFSWITVIVCGLWIGAVAAIAPRYRSLMSTQKSE